MHKIKLAFAILISLFCFDSYAFAQSQNSQIISRPERAFTRILIYSNINKVIANLKPIDEAPIKPNPNQCSEEYSKCLYSDNSGIKYDTNGLIIGRIIIEITNGIWRSQLPWGLDKSDSPKQVYNKIKNYGFPINGGYKTRDNQNKIYISWKVNYSASDPYFVNIIFDINDKIEKIEFRGLGW